MLQESTARVLVADDDATMGGFCARALSSAGYAVRTAADAEGALGALRADGPFDMLLADIQMPGLDGLELARIAREIDPAIAVVIMTGHSTPATVYASVRGGVADYLTKPFTLEELQAAVDQALLKRQKLQESLRVRALEQLLRSSEAINAILDREQLAHEIIARAREHLPCELCMLIIAGSSGSAPQVISEPEGATLLPGGPVAAGEGFRVGRPVFVNGEEPLAAFGERLFQRGLAVPLRAQGEAVGALLLCGDRPQLASHGAHEILALLAHQAGNALRNAHLYGEVQTSYQGLRELDRLKSEFIAIASHELRSPLAIVMGYAKMARDRSDGEPREYTQRVLDGAERIKGIVDDMMRLRDFDRQQLTFAPEPMDVNELARQAVERLAPAAHQKRQMLTTAYLPAPLALELDREKALLVVGNLLANAIKFTPAEGRIALSVERWTHEQLAATLARNASNPTVRRLGNALPPAWAVVRVQDNGIGIPRDQQHRIFERFYQVASSLTREQGGVGRGLAIVCDLATLHGGVVWVESEEGQGSTFSFGLPIADL
jgi:signal transduction histidine kinase